MKEWLFAEGAQKGAETQFIQITISMFAECILSRSNMHFYAIDMENKAKWIVNRTGGCLLV